MDAPLSSPSDSMELQERQEAESTSGSGYLSAAARRRRGRPPKNSNLDLSYSPPEKQMRTSGNPDNKNGHSIAEAMQHNAELAAKQMNDNRIQNGGGNISANGSAALMQAASSANSGKGNKGIRNRVFCGECGGCLKNDDCGKCRYCKDKTKFGGQNRLRQKCLHRRCQV